MNYEYKILYLQHDLSLLEWLNKCGAEGWELIETIHDGQCGCHDGGITHGYIFKRPLS